MDIIKLAEFFEETITKKAPYGYCPTCNKPGVTRCRCRLSDTTCEAGHEWHFVGDEIHLGKSDHSDASNHTGCKVIGQRK